MLFAVYLDLDPVSKQLAQGGFSSSLAIIFFNFRNLIPKIGSLISRPDLEIAFILKIANLAIQKFSLSSTHNPLMHALF